MMLPTRRLPCPKLAVANGAVCLFRFEQTIARAAQLGRNPEAPLRFAPGHHQVCAILCRESRHSLFAVGQSVHNALGVAV